MANVINQTFDLNDIQYDNLVAKQYMARDVTNLNKEKAKLITRQIPIQLLAVEWFSKVDQSTESRAYLIENFLPILVLGCEKVLKEAQKKNLIGKNDKDPNFNPLNYLAQFLMRNNPKFNNQNESSPYVRSMREVYQELRDQMFAIQGNRLAKVKEDVRKRRGDREKQEKLRSIEIARRKSQIEGLFSRFLLPPNGRLEISIMNECVKFYNENLINLSEDLKKASSLILNYPSYCYNRDELNSSKRLLRSEFVECILALTENLKNDLFDNFSEFFEECVVHFVHLANTKKFNKILSSLINIIDATNTGLISRRRLIKILRDFKEKNSNTNFRNPLEWPVLDPFIKFENKLEQIIPNVEPVSAEKSLINDSTAEQTAEQTSKPEENQQPANETLPEISEANEANQSSEEDKAEKTGETVTTDTTDGNTTSEPLPSAEITKESEIAPKKTVEESNLAEIIYPDIPKEKELHFIKGGKYYYTSLKEPLKAFDSSLLVEREQDENQEEINEKDILDEFDPEFLNTKQFINIISNYVSENFINSEIHVNDLIVHLKDSYAESRIEKNSKLVKITTLKKNLFRSKKYSTCFEKLDNEGSGYLNLNFLNNALLDFKEGLFKEHVANAINLIKSEITVNGKSDDLITRNEFFDLISILVGLVDYPKFEDQVLNYLGSLISYDITDKTRGEVRKKWLSQIKYVGDITYGSFDPLYKQLFFTVLKDAENHGLKRNISAYVGILENLNNDTIGLKYHASTPHDSKYLLGKTLTRNTKNVSFEVIDSSKPEHIQNVRSNSSVHYFNQENKSDGSLLIYPLKYARNKVFGTISVDTLQDTSKNSLFSDHELSFYQGVANTFAKAYANIIFKNRLIKTCINAVEWLNERCKGIEACNFYIVQILDSENKLNSDNDEMNQNTKNQKYSINLKPIIKYLFKNGKLEDVSKNSGNLAEEVLENKLGSKAYLCALVSETTVGYFNGKVSYYVPLRNEEHRTVLVLELQSKEYSKTPDKYELELEQIETVLYILHKCQEELLEAHFLGITNSVYEFENTHDQDKFEILFEKAYLKYVLEKLSQNSNEKVAETLPDETKSSDSPKIKNLIKLVSDLTGNKDFNTNQILDETLVSKLGEIDPTKKDFNFNSSTSNFKIAKPENLKDLHSYYVSLSSSSDSVRLLIDWACLLSNLKTKTSKIISNQK